MELWLLHRQVPDCSFGDLVAGVPSLDAEESASVYVDQAESNSCKRRDSPHNNTEKRTFFSLGCSRDTPASAGVAASRTHAAKPAVAVAVALLSAHELMIAQQAGLFRS